MESNERVIKQVIVMRRDLHMRRGKEIAQACHASMAFLTRKIQKCMEWQLTDDFANYHMTMSVETMLKLKGREIAWIKGLFTKICCRVNSEEDLLDVYNKAQAAGLEVHLITDSGKTEFQGIPTKTCLAIGPDYADVIDPITRHLELL